MGDLGARSCRPAKGRGGKMEVEGGEVGESPSRGPSSVRAKVNGGLP